MSAIAKLQHPLFKKYFGHAKESGPIQKSGAQLA
jgi:hypothetical protein